MSNNGVVADDPQNSVGQLFGTSKFLKPHPAGFVAEATISPVCCNFSCLPCSCPDVCSCVSDEFLKRSYMRVYENRLEINAAWSPATLCCCCGCAPKGWVRDNVMVYYFDQAPTTAGTYFPFCCPCNCCGRPIVWSFQTKCCCINCDQILGWTFCDCCACWNPTCCGRPLSYAFPMKDAETFLSAYKAAYESYATKRGIPRDNQARFFAVAPGCCGVSKNEVSNDMWNPSAARGCAELNAGGVPQQQMER